MAHWAEVDENNIVVRVLATSDEFTNEGYDWLIETYGGRWLKTSYNTSMGVHTLGGTPLRGNYAGIGFSYIEELDIFIWPSPYPSWVINTENYTWKAPIMPPDSGMWVWDEETVSWKEMNRD